MCKFCNNDRKGFLKKNNNMSTNFYIRYNICNQCDRYDEIHLGKSSAGWKFLFHEIKASFPLPKWNKDVKKLLKNSIIEYIKLDSFIDIENFLLKYCPKYIKIFDEYEEEISVKDFLELVKSKQDNKSHIHYCNEHNFPLDDYFMDESSYEFSKGDFS
jgi:hypothetical protein